MLTAGLPIAFAPLTNAAGTGVAAADPASGEFGALVTAAAAVQNSSAANGSAPPQEAQSAAARDVSRMIPAAVVAAVAGAPKVAAPSAPAVPTNASEAGEYLVAAMDALAGDEKGEADPDLMLDEADLPADDELTSAVLNASPLPVQEEPRPLVLADAQPQFAEHDASLAQAEQLPSQAVPPASGRLAEDGRPVRAGTESEIAARLAYGAALGSAANTIIPQQPPLMSAATMAASSLVPPDLAASPAVEPSPYAYLTSSLPTVLAGQQLLVGAEAAERQLTRPAAPIDKAPAEALLAAPDMVPQQFASPLAAAASPGPGAAMSPQPTALPDAAAAEALPPANFERLEPQTGTGPTPLALGARTVQPDAPVARPIMPSVSLGVSIALAASQGEPAGAVERQDAQAAPLDPSASYASLGRPARAALLANSAIGASADAPVTPAPAAPLIVQTTATAERTGRPSPQPAAAKSSVVSTANTDTPPSTDAVTPQTGLDAIAVDFGADVGSPRLDPASALPAGAPAFGRSADQLPSSGLAGASGARPDQLHQPNVQTAGELDAFNALAATRATRALANAVADGREVTVRIEPAALGRIDMTVGFEQNGTVRAVMQAAEAGTMELIRREAGAMAMALADSGLRADAQSIRVEASSSSSQSGFSNGNSGTPSGFSTQGGDGQAGNFQQGRNPAIYGETFAANLGLNSVADDAGGAAPGRARLSEQSGKRIDLMA